MLQYYVTYIELIYRINVHSWATQVLENGEQQSQSPVAEYQNDVDSWAPQ